MRVAGCGLRGARCEVRDAVCEMRGTGYIESAFGTRGDAQSLKLKAESNTHMVKGLRHKDKVTKLKVQRRRLESWEA